jgi:intracellular multiplication protein IcmP
MAGGGPQQQDDKGSYTILWVLVIIFVVGYGIWHFWSNELKTGFIFVKNWEARFVGLFTDNLDGVIQWTYQATPQDLTLKAADYISDAVGSFLIYPCILLIAFMAVIVFKSNIIMRFTKIYNMERLMQQEKENWPQISPVVDLDIMEMDALKGPWAMSMNPMQFGKHYKLLEVEVVKDVKAAWRAEGVYKSIVNKEKAKQIFSNQLGPLWQGIDHLSPYAKALFAIFAARGAHEPDVARAYLAELSLAAARGKMEYTQTDALLKKYADSKVVNRCIERHAYVLTVMAAMTEVARLDGVLASADFLWLKPVDRRLWYTLNNVGRQVAVPEVAGVFAHFKAEKEMGRPLSVPIIDGAVHAFCLAIENTIYVPDEGDELSLDTSQNPTPT